MAWSVDRPGRSLQDLVGFLSELHALKIDLFLRRQGLDTTTPACWIAAVNCRSGSRSARMAVRCRHWHP
jgi:hypothetical protein